MKKGIIITLCILLAAGLAVCGFIFANRDKDGNGQSGTEKDENMKGNTEKQYGDNSMSDGDSTALKTVKMLENASPDNGAMCFYYFDGENTTSKWLFDSVKEKEIINDINSLDTRAVSSDRMADIKVPCYGIMISDTEGFDILLTYSNDLWLMKDGSVWEAAFDLKALYESVEDRACNTFESGIYMPNAAWLAKYDVRFCKKSDEMTDTKDGIRLSVVSYENNVVKAKLQNETESDFLYGEYFSLQKKIDNEWYNVPVKLSNFGFKDIGLILPSKSEREIICDLLMYGELEKGAYRLEKEGMAAEFDVR